MNDQVKETLAELIKKYGTSLVDDPRRLEGLLRDLCGENKREIFVIITAMKARVAENLLTLPQGIPPEIYVAKLKKRLVEDLALADDAAFWAVQTWMYVLGLNLSHGQTANQFGKIQTGSNSRLTNGNEGKKAETSPVFTQGELEISPGNLTNGNPCAFYMENWSRRVTNFDELPECFRGFSIELTSGSPSSTPHIIYAPADQWGQKKSNPKLFCVFEERVIFLEASQANLTRHTFPIREISIIEVGNILLYSWIKVNGTVDGREASAIMEYNTVAKQDVFPVIELMRAIAIELRPQTDKSLLKIEWDKFENLAGLNYKYMNAAKESILPGEKVLGFVYQPQIRPDWSNQAVSAHVVILTDRELIFIQDENTSFKQEKQYGIIRHHIPLSKIQQMLLESSPNNQISLILNLFPRESIVRFFDLTKLRELKNLVDQYSTLRL